MTTDAVLEVENLVVSFPTDDGLVKAVDGVSFTLAEGETLGIVGESGSGKSVTSMAIMGLHSKRAQISGSIKFRGQELIGLDERRMRELRGRKVAMVFQDALAALNPVFKIGDQISEAMTVHSKQSKSAVTDRVMELMDLVGIPDPTKRINQFPHELSGGMRQRIMIAIAIANDPDVLIADEPTTALDVTVQAQVLEVIERIQQNTGTAIMLITHDLGVVAGMADRVLVMYAGRPVEIASVDAIFHEPCHAYTEGLLASLPRLDRRRDGEKLYRIGGQPPSVIHLPTGCAFAPRCARVRPGECDVARLELREVGHDHLSACVAADEIIKERAQ